MNLRDRAPRAREDGLLVEAVGDETVVYDSKTKEAHCLSPLAAVVFANSNGRTTIEQLASLAAERLGEPVEEEQVLDALAQLEEREFMAVPASGQGGISRRGMLRRSAGVAGGAVAASLVSTVVVPNAVAASSATCANLECCPCCSCCSLEKSECCTITNVTINCQCTNGSRVLALPGQTPPNACAKYCKPSGNSSPSDAQCAAKWTSAALVVEQCDTVAGGSQAGLTACNGCAGCRG